MRRIDLISIVRFKLLPLVYFTQVDYFQSETQVSFTVAKVIVQAILLRLWEDTFSPYYQALIDMIARYSD